MDEATDNLAHRNKLALIVGVNNSPNTPIYRADLKHAEKDADDIAYLLRQPQCGFTLSTSPLIREKATTVAIKHSLIALSKKRDAQDFLLFYFAGHAVPINDDIYLVTYDFEDSDVEEDTSMHLSMRWLWDKLYRSSSAGCVLIILDCCYAGNIVETQDDPYKIDLRQLLDKWNGDSGTNLSHNRTRHILTATGYNFKAQELNGHGFMTGLLISALQGKEDEALDKEGNVEIGSLYNYLRDKMPETQKPDLAGQFGPHRCILAAYPHLSERLRVQYRENEIKDEVERGIFSKLFRLYTEIQHVQPFDHSVCLGASLNDIDWEKITEFLEQERVQQEEAFQPGIPVQDQFVQFGFLQETFPTYGALLCFGRSPSKWVAGAVTRCIDWEGHANMDRVPDSREYKGSLLRQFEFSLNFLKKRLRLRRVIDREGREEQWEIPSAVIEEALANALVHREYANRTDSVRVELFDDRIEICSPGTLPPHMTEDLLRVKHRSYPRNPQIAGIFYLHRYVEKLGTGIQRMQRFMKENSLPEPKFILGEDQTFTVILYRPKQEMLRVQSSTETVLPEHPLEVRLEAIGQLSGQFTLTFDSSQYPITLNPKANFTFSDWLHRLRPVLTGLDDPAGNNDPHDLLRSVGMWLWQVLLPESAPTQEREALAYTLRTGRTPLLLVLPDTLVELPWELLYDPESLDGRGFLVHRRPLMRLAASSTPITPVKAPLRVLLLISSPPSLGADSRVDVESERAAVEQATREAREAGFLHLLVEDIVTVQRVQRILVRFKPHIVHYIGHGGYDKANGGVLLWEDEQGNEMPLSAERLADLLLSRNLHALVLHACQTGRSNAQVDVYGIAKTQANEGLPAVLAQQANLTYESSQRASEALYTALTAGQSFVEALFEVRRALTLADRPDWASPILYGSIASLTPFLDSTVLPGPPDPLLTSRGVVTNLPTPAGIFVGRHRELRALRLMLENAPGSGPVMAFITGPGGVGKSTLAAQAVIRHGGTYKATLTLSCLGYQSIELFLQRIGEFLKGQGVPGFLEQCLPDPRLSTQAKIAEAIVALNAAGPLLLIIDNLESVQNDDQMIRDGALLHLLQKLLTDLNGGRVIITGRYAVKDLLPQGKFAANLLHLSLDDLSIYETNQLLMRHPALARLTETVRRRLVDEFGGLPYVYDLLSSDAASQSLDELIHDVQGRITPARKQHSTKEWQEVRQQVIEFAALEATVNRLSAASHALLAQLSVLHRPFPLAAVEEGLSAVRTAWQPLLDRSLLHYDPQEKSYHLHSLTRSYAEGLLEEQSRKQAQTQLAIWYEHYADQDPHNLAAYLEAHRLLRGAGNVQQAGQLVMQIAETLRRFGLYPLLRDLCTQTLSDVHESDERLTADVLHTLGTLAYLQGEYEEARRLYQQSLAIADQLGDLSERATALHALGMIAQDQGEYEEARRLYQQSLAIADQLGDLSERANSLQQLGILAYSQGEYEEARRLCQQSLVIKEQLGDQRGRANSLHQLGVIAQDQGEYEEARGFYQQSLATFELLGDQSGRANSLGKLGTLTYNQGNFEDALRYTIQAYILFNALGSPSRTFAQRMIARIRSQMDKATFMTHWHALAGDRPLVAVMEQEETQDTDKGMVEKVLKFRCAYADCGKETTVITKVSKLFPTQSKSVTRVYYCEHCNRPNTITIPDNFVVHEFIL